MRASPLAFAGLLSGLLAWSGTAAVGAPRGGDLVVLTDHAVDGSGRPITAGVIVIQGGRITALAPAGTAAPAGLPVLDARSRFVMPGLVDARSGAGLEHADSEESSEITPSLSVLDLVDPTSAAFENALRSGVTSVGLAPGGRAVFGGTGAALKTDARPLDQRIVSAETAVILTLGTEPAFGNRVPRFQRPEGLYYRRPGNRMGVMSAARRALEHAAGGTDEADAPLRRALAGQLPVQVRARTEADIRSALRLADEFGLRLVLVDPVEGHRLLDALAERHVPCLLGPFYQAPRVLLEAWEGEDLRHGLAGILSGAGVTLAIGSGPDEPASAARDGASHAVRHGLSREAALAALTSVPARLLGVEARIGDLRPGQDGDLAIFTTNPLTPSARPLAVIIEGRVVFRDPEFAPPATLQEPAP